MTFVGNTKLKSSTWDKSIIQLEVNVEFNSRIAYEIVMVWFTRLLPHPIGRMQINNV